MIAAAPFCLLLFTCMQFEKKSRAVVDVDVFLVSVDIELVNIWDRRRLLSMVKLKVDSC